MGGPTGQENSHINQQIVGSWYKAVRMVDDFLARTLTFILMSHIGIAKHGSKIEDVQTSNRLDRKLRGDSRLEPKTQTQAHCVLKFNMQRPNHMITVKGSKSMG